MNLTLTFAERLSARVLELLSPHCERLEVAGAVRRRAEPVHRLEVVCIPRRFKVQTTLFDTDWVVDTAFRQAVDQWVNIKGKAGEDRYLERWLPGAYTLCLHIADEDNFGLQLALATGNFAFRETLKEKWARKRLTSAGGYLRKKKSGELLPLQEERELFALLKMTYVEPHHRNQELTDEQRDKLDGKPRQYGTGRHPQHKGGGKARQV